MGMKSSLCHNNRFLSLKIVSVANTLCAVKAMTIMITFEK